MVDTTILSLKLINKTSGTTTDGSKGRMKTKTKSQPISSKILRENGRLITKKKPTKRRSKSLLIVSTTTQMLHQTTRRKLLSKTKEMTQDKPTKFSQHPSQSRKNPKGKTIITSVIILIASQSAKNRVKTPKRQTTASTIIREGPIMTDLSCMATRGETITRGTENATSKMNSQNKMNNLNFKTRIADINQIILIHKKQRTNSRVKVAVPRLVEEKITDEEVGVETTTTEIDLTVGQRLRLPNEMTVTIAYQSRALPIVEIQEIAIINKHSTPVTATKIGNIINIRIIITEKETTLSLTIMGIMDKIRITKAISKIDNKIISSMVTSTTHFLTTTKEIALTTFTTKVNKGGPTP
jgi:hypothetical protein